MQSCDSLQHMYGRQAAGLKWCEESRLEVEESKVSAKLLWYTVDHSRNPKPKSETENRQKSHHVTRETKEQSSL